VTALAYRHQRVQRLRRLVARRSARDAEGVFVIEGPKLLAEALRAGVVPESVYVDPAGVGGGDGLTELLDRVFAAGGRLYELEAGVLAKVAGTVTPQPVLAVVPRVEVTVDELCQRDPTLVVVCVDVRDPGNAGTVLRSAEASGASGVICCDGSVDVFNPKTVRASAGSIFHLPVVASGSVAEVLDRLGRAGLRRVGAVARGGDPYWEVDLVAPTALVLGNEARGLPEAAAGLLDGSLTIPMAGRAESLNVGMAAAVVCFEAARQRRSAAHGGGNGPAAGHLSL